MAEMVAQLRGLVAVFENRRTGTDLAATLRTQAAVLDSIAGCARALAAAEDVVALVSQRSARANHD